MSNLPIQKLNETQALSSLATLGGVRMVDLSTTPLEQLKLLQFACDHWFLLARHGKQYSVKSLYRWARYGLRGVKLKVLYTTDGAVTSESAVREFIVLIDKKRRMPTDTSMTEEEMAAAGF